MHTNETTRTIRSLVNRTQQVISTRVQVRSLLTTGLAVDRFIFKTLLSDECQDFSSSSFPTMTNDDGDTSASE